VNGIGLASAVLLSTALGILAGFAAGLVPGLHMNNVAAVLVAYSAASFTFFGFLGDLFSAADAGLLASCFLCSSLMAHQFSEALVSTYIGIPDGDVLSVLPAHRLARAGMGSAAMRSSADGSLAGVVLAIALITPVCLIMGDPVGLYDILASGMGFIVAAFSVGLVMSDSLPGRGPTDNLVARAHRATSSAVIFLAAGVLGATVLQTDYLASPIPDLPWMHCGFVRRSSLLLPMFAGLFGIPNLILSLNAKSSLPSTPVKGDVILHRPGIRDYVLSLFGGVLVGWMPGMTAGSSASMCSIARDRDAEDGDLRNSLGFIWLCSAIAAAGAVFAVAAFFVISRERSGCMQAVSFYLGPGSEVFTLSEVLPFTSMLLSLAIASVASYHMLLFLIPRAARMRTILSSRILAAVSMALVCSLIILLTGTRGALLVTTATALGLLTISMKVRRIQLMGSLLVPIAISFFTD